jgi:putative transposase
MLDNGPEFVSKALDRWAYENGVTLDFSRPGKPTDNAFVESFNGRLRDECMNASTYAGSCRWLKRPPKTPDRAYRLG